MLMAYDDNYEPYLKSLGIPSFVVPLILRASETINVTVTETGATMTTETGQFYSWQCKPYLVFD